ncbi:MAG: hypothetical protein KDD56_04290 [Bdellovibrionales bacterium]|nr:hypothetical protein [Bdellovibrionales bacterium]
MDIDSNSSQSLQADIELIADYILKKKLSEPALFLLEAHRPVLNFLGEILTVLMPSLSVFLPIEKFYAFRRILGSQKGISELILKLETPGGS